MDVAPLHGVMVNGPMNFVINFPESPAGNHKLTNAPYPQLRRGQTHCGNVCLINHTDPVGKDGVRCT